MTDSSPVRPPDPQIVDQLLPALLTFPVVTGHAFQPRLIEQVVYPVSTAVQQPPKPVTQISTTAVQTNQESCLARIWRVFTQAIQTVIDTIRSFLCCEAKPVQKPPSSSNEQQVSPQIQPPPEPPIEPAPPQTEPVQSTNAIVEEEVDPEIFALKVMLHLLSLKSEDLTEERFRSLLQEEPNEEIRFKQLDALPKIVGLDDYGKMDYHAQRTACRRNVALLDNHYVLMIDRSDKAAPKYCFYDLSKNPVEFHVYEKLSELPKVKYESFKVYILETAQ